MGASCLRAKLKTVIIALSLDVIPNCDLYPVFVSESGLECYPDALTIK